MRSPACCCMLLCAVPRPPSTVHGLQATSHTTSLGPESIKSGRQTDRGCNCPSYNDCASGTRKGNLKRKLRCVCVLTEHNNNNDGARSTVVIRTVRPFHLLVASYSTQLLNTLPGIKVRSTLVAAIILKSVWSNGSDFRQYK